MSFTEIIKAALELGVVPTLALFLVFAVYLQNRQLIKDRREMETRLLTSLNQVLTDYRVMLMRTYDKGEGHVQEALPTKEVGEIKQ
jgi:hypothetical protein